MAKTTKKDFAVFHNECVRFIDLLGLYDYEIRIQHGPCKELGYCWYDDQGRSAIIELGPDWGDNNPVDKDSVKSAASHEVLELLFSRVRTMLNEHHAEKRTDREIHRLITTLQNAFAKANSKREK